jgi:hypothetical protein
MLVDAWLDSRRAACIGDDQAVPDKYVVYGSSRIES